MSGRICATPECGHPKRRHYRNWGCEALTPHGACKCAAFVADGGPPEPEPFPPAVASDAITQTLADQAGRKP